MATPDPPDVPGDAPEPVVPVADEPVPLPAAVVEPEPAPEPPPEPDPEPEPVKYVSSWGRGGARH